MILKNHLVFRIVLSFGKTVWISSLLIIFYYFLLPLSYLATGLTDLGFHLIPYPQKLAITRNTFNFSKSLNIVRYKNRSVAGEFTANKPGPELRTKWNTNAVQAYNRGDYSIVLNRKNLSKPGKERSHH